MNSQNFCQLHQDGNRRIALAALDPSQMSHRQTCFAGERFLAQSA